MCAEPLGITKNFDLIEKVLVVHGMCFSPKQVDDMLVACDRGENPLKLRIDGYANLIPIFDGASVFFLDVGRGSYGWYVLVGRFGGSGRWGAGGVVLFRN